MQFELDPGGHYFFPPGWKSGFKWRWARGQERGWSGDTPGGGAKRKVEMGKALVETSQVFGSSELVLKEEQKTKEGQDQ